MRFGLLGIWEHHCLAWSGLDRDSANATAFALEHNAAAARAFQIDFSHGLQLDAGFS
jgi:hypothetical protein